MLRKWGIAKILWTISESAIPSITLQKIFSKVYDRIADGFHDVIKTVAKDLHNRVGKLLVEVVSIDEDHSMDSKVIDICCGTGLVGVALRKHGFTGIIDGQDGVQGMIAVASSLGIYNKISCCAIVPGKDLSDALPSDEYDILTTCYSLFPNHIQIESLKSLIDCVRVGGLLAMNVHLDDLDGLVSYNERLLQLCAQLESDGVWKCVKDVIEDKANIRENYWATDVHTDYVPSKILIFKKL